MHRFFTKRSKYLALKLKLTRKEDFHEQGSINGAGGFQVFENKTRNRLSISEKEGDTLH